VATAAVWTAALLFFQLILLAGYLYAHCLVRYLSPKRQFWVHGSLLIASLALYRHRLFGASRRTYAITVVIALYFNVFVLVIQSFLKIPALTALAPGNPPSGPVFAAVQGIVLLFFVFVIVRLVRRSHPA